MAIPTSTYRLQVRPSFDLSAAAAACDVLAGLGVSAVYLSPLLPSAAGSDHGYDVVGFDGIDGQRGGQAGWTRLLDAARSLGLGTLVDIVPNHSGVADPIQNAAWWDVLAHGRASRFASWFDIDWSSGPLLLPVLGDDMTEDDFIIDGTTLRAGVHALPLDPDAPPQPGESAAEVHQRQHYRLVNFRRADTDQNYRRFFAVTSLAGLRVEDPAVFAATHAQIRRWVDDDHIDGLRVDHPDGLADPYGYLTRLRELSGPRAWLLVEKILEPGERMPAEWPVDGTTGYDALAEVTNLFVDPAAEARFDALYRELTGDRLSFREHVSRGKQAAATTILRAEVSRLARLVPELPRAADALTELLVSFDVYRTYLPSGREYLDEAVRHSTASRPDLAETIAALLPRLTEPGDELCVRFQQTSGAVMAKGVEDTAFYRYTRFVALNEVGGNPGQFGANLDEWHRAQHERMQTMPRSMTTLSTHDTKRGEDVRARLAALAEFPEHWSTTVRTLMGAAPIPDAAFAYLLWQTFAGAGFIDRARMHAYAEKAMREAAVSTTWIDPDHDFEASVHAAVDAAYDDEQVHGPLADLITALTAPGRANSLSQKLVQLTMPGVPDVYQGTEFWDDSLVDPDNRRPIDVERTRRSLAELDRTATPPPVDDTGLAKLWITSRALRLRRDEPTRFTGYTPLRAQGECAEHAVAFNRGAAITLATRLPAALAEQGGWGNTALDLAEPVTDILTGRSWQGEVRLDDVLQHYPVALLIS